MYPDEHDLSDKQKRVTYELYGLGHTIKRYLDALTEKEGIPHHPGGKGISGANLMIIGYLYENRHRDVFQRDLEEKLNVRRSTISKVLQIMESKDLITREQVEQDGRLKKIVLTQRSLEGITFWKQHSSQMESRLTRGFTEEELDQFFCLLHKAKNNLENP